MSPGSTPAGSSARQYSTEGVAAAGPHPGSHQGVGIAQQCSGVPCRRHRVGSQHTSANSARNSSSANGANKATRTHAPNTGMTWWSGQRQQGSARRKR